MGCGRSGWWVALVILQAFSKLDDSVILWSVIAIYQALSNLEAFYWIWFEVFIEMLNSWSWAEPCAALRAIWRRLLLNGERLMQRGVGPCVRAPHGRGNERVSTELWSWAAEGLWFISSNHCMGKLGRAIHVRTTAASEFYCHWTVTSLTLRVTELQACMHSACGGKVSPEGSPYAFSLFPVFSALNKGMNWSSICCHLRQMMR